MGGGNREEVGKISCLGQPAPTWAALVLERQRSPYAKAYTHYSAFYKAFPKCHPISSSQFVREVGRYYYLCLPGKGNEAQTWPGKRWVFLQQSCPVSTAPLCLTIWNCQLKREKNDRAYLSLLHCGWSVVTQRRGRVVQTLKKGKSKKGKGRKREERKERNTQRAERSWDKTQPSPLSRQHCPGHRGGHDQQSSPSQSLRSSGEEQSTSKQTNTAVEEKSI